MKHNLDISSLKEKNIYPLSDKFFGIAPNGDKISFTNYYMQLNDKPYFGISGECPISRVAEYMWEDSIIKMKMSGINTVASYTVWNHHEEIEGDFKFEGNKNLRKFVELCKKHNMFVNLRIGPFVHGEVRNGGLPDWLYGKPFDLRTTNDGYLFYVERWYKKLAEQFEGLYFKDGGPIVSIQLENEYGHSSAPWNFAIDTTNEWTPSGTSGDAHMIVLKEMAIKLGLIAPYYTCTGWGGSPTPTTEFLPLHGAYAYWPWIYYHHTGDHPALEGMTYFDYHKKTDKAVWNFDVTYDQESVPYMCCEMGTGMTVSYRYRFQVDPESGNAIANTKLGSGCNYFGYYIFRGGTNPDSYGGIALNENQNPKKSYDFQTAIGEYGQIRESYRRIKLLHFFVKNYEEILCPLSTITPANADIKPTDLDSLRWCVRTNGKAGFIFINNFQDHVVNKDKVNHDIELNFNEKSLSINNISLSAKEEAVLPFNFSLNGYNLNYAKAQLISDIDDNGIKTYFFFTPKGMNPEFAFDNAGIKTINNTTVTSSETIIKCNSNNTETIELDGDFGKVKIILLTREESLNYNEFIHNGKKIVAISDFTLLYNDGKLFAENPNNEISSGDVKFYPQNAVENITFQNTEEIPVSYKEVAPYKYVLDIPQGLAEHKEILLKVKYKGDVGYLFIDGKLIADDFANGSVWETGLKDFLHTIYSKNLVLAITPLKKGSTVNVTSAMAGFFEEYTEAVAEIENVSIKLFDEQEIALNF